MARTTSYDYKEVEEGIIKFWEDNKIYPRIKKKGEGKQKFFFIQGPPYTSGKIHIGTAWNNGMKDTVLRYKRMKGFEVFDRAAYDMHGLPTANKVMAKHNLENKEAIEKFGVENFMNECLTWSVEKAADMNKDLWRIGVWMDFENACHPIDNSYIEGEWFLIKKAHEKNRLYEGLRTMSWCAKCQTAMAKHECEYKEVTDKSIFVKLPVEGKENEYLIVWTTTPWTISFNLAVMVHPELEYVKAKVGDEVWVLSKALAAPVVQNFTEHKLEILDEFPGKQLEGLAYNHPWNKRWNHYKEIKEKHPKAHTVILSDEYVDTSAGTGLVHCAPGCGPEDYEVGHRNNIPAFNNLGEDGVFPEDMGEFAGLRAKKDDKEFIKAMKEDGMIVAQTPIEHDYAHCQRCHEPVVFRTTKQWFFKIEDLKDRMIEENEKTYWVPEKAKNAFRSWLNNLRDNSITKQRYFGTPVPIWKCETCGKYEVIGSQAELKEKAGHCPDNLHKPWIDSVEINCSCGSMMKRIPDILDVWIDAGTLCWNILDYPNRKDLFDHYFPADFIIEGKDQIRGWFNLLMVASILALDRPCFKNVYMHGFVTDVDGVKMSKSLGNVISPYEVIDKYGADTLRLYMTHTNAGEDVNYSWEEIALRHRNLIVIWNMHKYLLELSRVSGIKPVDVMSLELGPVEKYILSRTHSTVKDLTQTYDEYRLSDVPQKITDLFLDLSRTYIQMTRDKSNGSDEDKKIVISTIYHSIMNAIKALSPLCPFITEKIYANFLEGFGSDLSAVDDCQTDSIHDCNWPKANENLIDVNLEKKFDVMKSVIQGILASREKAQLGVRWPVKEVLIVTKNEGTKEAVKALEEMIKVQTNVKALKVIESFNDVKTTVKADFAKLGPTYGEKSPLIVAKLSQLSPESILNGIENEGKYILDMDGEEIEILKEHLIVKREVPETHIEAECRGGLVYLDMERNSELDTEGYARELMRRVQSMRKESGLVKEDRISLFIQTDENTFGELKVWNDAIKDRVGASQMNLTYNESPKSHEHKKKVKIKDKEFMVEFNKI